MRGSQRRNRRLKTAGAAFSLVGLVMTLFLAIGQVGLLAANADGWSDRSGDAPASAETDDRGDGLTVSASGRVSTRDEGAATPVRVDRAVEVGDIDLDWIAAGPYTYNHLTLAGTGAGLPQYDGRVIDKSTGVFESLEASDFNCNDKVVYFLMIEVDDDPVIDAPSTISVSLEFDNENGVGFRDFDSPAVFLNTDDSAYVGDAGIANVVTNAPVAAPPPATDLTVSFDVTDVERGEVIIVQVVPILKCGGAGSPNGNLQARLDSMTIGGRNVPGSGTQTIPLKSAKLLLEPDLTIVKSGPSTVAIGGQVTYTVTVQNIGNGPTSEAVHITDSVPAELSNVAATFSLNGGAAQACTVTGNDVDCNVGILAAGATVVVTITADAPTDTCPTVTNYASIEIGTATQDSNTVDTTVTGCAAIIELHKTGPATVSVGGTVSYTVTVENTGNTATANSVVVTDTVDSDLSGVTATFSLNGGADQACTVVGNDVSCDLGILDPGDSVVITIEGTAPTGVCPQIVNQAFIGQVGSEIVTTTVTGCQTPTPPPPPPTPGIQIVKDGPATAHVGDTITYTFDVSLISGSPSLTNVTVTDPICDAGTLTGPAGDDGDSILEQGETWSYSCTHVVTDTDPDPLPNTATAEGHYGNTTVSDSDDHVVDIVHPAIQVEKRARPQSGSPGEEITYTYTITNIGDVTLVDISVDDDVIGHICDIASLDPGESAECTATFTIPDDGSVRIRNVVVAEGEDEWGVPVSDDDTEVIDVILGQTVTPTKTPPGGTAFTGTSAAIPLGAIALIFLTAGTALLWVGRRRGRHAPIA